MAYLFLTVLDMSLSASWIILAVLAARLVLKKAPKWMICSLWALVALRLLCPISLESSFSLIPDQLGHQTGEGNRHPPLCGWKDTLCLYTYH